MTEKKSSFYIGLGVGGATVPASLRLQLDADIYNTAILTQTGLTSTDPDSLAKIIPCKKDTACNSNAADYIKCTVYQGASLDLATETRLLKIVCETSKLATAKVGLLDKTVNLGRGAGSSWKIGRAV